MKCKACNADHDPHWRTIKETGERVLEDLCSVCRRWVYVKAHKLDDDVQSELQAFLGIRHAKLDEG